VKGIIRPLDQEALHQFYQRAEPFPYFKVDDFLEPDFARSVVAAYPSYQAARDLGLEFNAARERLKIQVTEKERFPEAVRRLSDALAGREFLSALEVITGIPRLLDDPQLAGGGMHLSESGGRLDVHVDFNYIAERKLHRRLNILVYLNEQWNEEWGGNIELWNKDVTRCHHSFSPIFNRCVVFETSDVSYHGVTPIRCPKGTIRRSFAGYYYTLEPPPNWDGVDHSTVFKTRPSERLRGAFLGAADAFRNQIARPARRFVRALRQK
jgi:hypothetical protein